MKYFTGICNCCKYKNRMTIESPCYTCISNEDIALKTLQDTEFANFEINTENTEQED